MKKETLREVIERILMEEIPNRYDFEDPKAGSRIIYMDSYNSIIPGIILKKTNDSKRFKLKLNTGEVVIGEFWPYNSKLSRGFFINDSG